MPTSYETAYETEAADAPPPSAVALSGFTYEDRQTVLGSTLQALEKSGCWVSESRATSAGQVELDFEMQLRDADDLYSELVGAGVEMTRDSHLALTWLCTLRRHKKVTPRAEQSVNLRLKMRFLEEYEVGPAGMAAGVA